MTTTEKWVLKTLDDNGIVANADLIIAAAEQIDMENAMRDRNELYTPDDWLKDTKDNYPELLLSDKMYKPVCEWLIAQRNECMDQRGDFPCIYDYTMGLESEDFENYLDEQFNVRPNITLDDIFNFLLLQYEFGGKMNG